MKGRDRPRSDGTEGERAVAPDREELRRRAEERAAAHESVTISPLAAPLFALGLVPTAVLTYITGPWGLLVLVPLLVIALALALARPEHREGAIGLALGAALGFGLVMGAGLLGFLG